MSRGLWESAWSGVTRNMAFTAPSSPDERLRGRTYAIPFEEVWQGSMNLLGGGIRGWTVREADDQEGIIRGTARGWLDRFESAVTIRVALDGNAQTRVDALSASRVGRADLGVNARRIGRFFRDLDRALADARGGPIDRWIVEPAPSPRTVAARQAG